MLRSLLQLRFPHLSQPRLLFICAYDHTAASPEFTTFKFQQTRVGQTLIHVICAYDSHRKVCVIVVGIAVDRSKAPSKAQLRWHSRLRFSTKPQDGMTGLYYYGYRFYDAGSGRWLSRDPIGELGGENLYSFIYNNANGWYDELGSRPRRKPYQTIRRGFRDKKNVKRNKPYTSKKQADQARAFDELIVSARNRLENKYGKFDAKLNSFKEGAQTQYQAAIETALSELFDPRVDELLSDYLAGVPFGGGGQNAWYNRNVKSCEKQRASLILKGVISKTDPGCCLFTEISGLFLGDVVFKGFTASVYVSCKKCSNIHSDIDNHGSIGPDDGNARLLIPMPF